MVDGDTWRAAAHALADSGLSLLGLWGEPSRVHMAILDDRTSDIGVISLDCPDRQFPSVAAYHPPALRLERTLHDLFGLQATGTPDPRPWLDHGRWQTRFPLGERRDASADAAPYQFLPAEGDSLHQIAVGPVHAGIIEPGHFRFTASGETVVRLEQRLGYTHKGVEGLMTGSTIEQAARLAGRVSGDSTVAYGLAFAQAVEAAQRIAVPPRALLLRALMAELERLANHLGDIGAICNDASFALMQAHCAVLRESVLRAADAAFGHRLMRDLVVPGGVARDIAGDGADAIRAVLDRIRRHFPALVELYDNTASLQDRTVSTGIVPPALAKQFAAGGYVGRASGRDHDARRRPGYLPYDGLRFEVPVLGDGDVNARVWIRIREVEQSLALAYQILIGLEAGPVKVPLHNTAEPCEGMALVEGFRGDILAWLRLNGDRIERCHLRDPSWFQWPLLEAAIEGNIVADFPLCNKSFNCSYSGQDL
ncbi:Ni,Fe-hydrogenase III large subunit [Bradyrhizobium elkanii]